MCRFYVNIKTDRSVYFLTPVSVPADTAIQVQRKYGIIMNIKEIAVMAGVSRGTVDRVLNNRGGVNEETAHKVRKIAAMANYIPNKAGKTLAIKKRGLKLGMMLLNSPSKNPFIADVLQGMQKQSRELEDYGVNVEFRQTMVGAPEQQLACIDELKRAGIHGLAIMPENDTRIQRKLLELKECGIPVVTVNSDIDGAGRIAYVGSNYYRAGETAAGLMSMITNGSAQIGIVNGGENVLCHTARVKGFQHRIAEKYQGLKVVKIICNHDDEFESLEKTKKLLTEYPEISALYLTAGGVYGACRAVMDLGLSGKMKVICFDTVPTTQEMLINGTILAAIDQQPSKQGSLPLKILFDYLAMGIEPEAEYYFTSNVIKTLESL